MSCNRKPGTRCADARSKPSTGACQRFAPAQTDLTDPRFPSALARGLVLRDSSDIGRWSGALPGYQGQSPRRLALPWQWAVRRDDVGHLLRHQRRPASSLHEGPARRASSPLLKDRPDVLEQDEQVVRIGWSGYKAEPLVEGPRVVILRVHRHRSDAGYVGGLQRPQHGVFEKT